MTHSRTTSEKETPNRSAMSCILSASEGVNPIGFCMANLSLKIQFPPYFMKYIDYTIIKAILATQNTSHFSLAKVCYIVYNSIW